MNKPNKHDVVVQAVKQLKLSEHGTTAIKVEVEANIEREHSDKDTWAMIAERLEPLGLTRYNEDDYFRAGHTGYSSHWFPKLPLRYGEVYNDGSVDTEFTFTLMLNNPENILLLPKILQIVVDVYKEVGYELDTSNAGMHMALLNNAKGTYPTRPKAYDISRFKNFRKSMIRLLPALYFLGSCTERSRALRFREPKIEHCQSSNNGQFRPGIAKYSAVAFSQGAVEFRVFETCYDNPEVILDNVVVMANAMKFWTRAYTRNYLRPMPQAIKFGTDRGYDLQRLYVTKQHIDLLHDGLNILKPMYYSINELKKQRNFTVTKKSIDGKLKEVKQKALESYVRYDKQFKWSILREEQRYMARLLDEYVEGIKDADPDKDRSKVMLTLQQRAKQLAKQNISAKQKRKSFIDSKIADAIPQDGGNWPLNDGDRPEPPRIARPQPITDDMVMEAAFNYNINLEEILRGNN